MRLYEISVFEFHHRIIVVSLKFVSIDFKFDFDFSPIALRKCEAMGAWLVGVDPPALPQHGAFLNDPDSFLKSKGKSKRRK